MGVTSEILGNSGSPHQIEHNGKIVRLSLIDQAVQTAFEKRMYEKECAGARIQMEQGLRTQEQYAKRLDDLAAAYRDGDYEILSETGQSMLSKVSGVRFLLGLLTGLPDRELISLLLAKKTEVIQKIQLVIAESFPGSVPASGSAGESKPSEGGSPNG